MSYEWLRDRIKLWSPNAAVTGEIDTIISMAEDRINDDIVIKSIERQQVDMMDGGVIFLPEDFHRMQRLTFMYRDREQTVGYIAPSAAEVYTDQLDGPFGYTFLDQTIQLFPSPDGQYEYTLYYIPRISTVVGKTTNWLLSTRKDIYLFACLAYASVMVKDAEKAAFYDALYMQQLDRLKSSESARVMPIAGNSIRMSRRAV